jgi:hypothetical protein
MNEIQIIQQKIYGIRGQRVMLDFDLAELYRVETRALNQAVKRNIDRFPDDFMFRLSPTEWEVISSQFVMTSRAKRPKSSLPLAFTEHGALMLASVLRSDIAVEISIKVTRAFVAIRRMAASLPPTNTAADLAQLRQDFEELKLDIEDILANQNEINEDTRAQLELINQSLAALQSTHRLERRPISGFSLPNKEKK